MSFWKRRKQSSEQTLSVTVGDIDAGVEQERCRLGTNCTRRSPRISISPSTTSYDWLSLAVILGASCLYALAALLVAVKLFQREEVLFRT